MSMYTICEKLITIIKYHLSRIIICKSVCERTAKGVRHYCPFMLITLRRLKHERMLMHRGSVRVQGEL